MTSLNETASWVIVRKADGVGVMETFNPATLNFINTEKYRAVPILEYLQGLNRDLKITGRA